MNYTSAFSSIAVYGSRFNFFQEEMSDLRSLIRLKEKELRCLEWGLMAQRAHEGLGEELEDREAEQQVETSAAAAERGFSTIHQITQSQGETSKREQDAGRLRRTRFKSGCPTREITHLPKQNPSRLRGYFGSTRSSSHTKS